MILFNGITLALERENRLREKIQRDLSGKKLVIAAILFSEDAGSRLYTRLKGEAAARVGIEYRVYEFSLSDENDKIQTKIEELGLDPEVTGIIIQKPWRKTWVVAQGLAFIEKIAKQPDPNRLERDLYTAWWSKLTFKIHEHKDVDGLHPKAIAEVISRTWQENRKVLPATCQAVLSIFDQAFKKLSHEVGLEKTQTIFNGKYVILGKSDLLGIPLFYELKRQGRDVEILASKDLEQRMQSGQKLLDAKVIVSATGRKGLITGDMVSENVVVVDVGEPRPDVDFSSVSLKAAFITPVPGGVGPMTVISLLENCVTLAEAQRS